MTTDTGSTKARVSMLDRDEVQGEMAQLFDTLKARRGVVPNMFRVLAHVPPLAQAVAGFASTVLADGSLPGWYKELIAVKVSEWNGCEYAAKAHSILALQRGATQEQLDALSGYERGPFTEREKRFIDGLRIPVTEMPKND